MIYRHGTTTLFAALDELDGKVITQYQPRHRHQEFLEFLKHLDSSLPPGLEAHLITDHDGTHQHAKVKAWLARHPRYRLHYTPTYSSWLNQVERWFRLITQQAIRRGSCRRPFVWTATADSILAKLRRICKVINRTKN
jgi:putative transposase